ncbi:MerR family transcriptional regulator [Actinoplanes awajinensis]|uniref:MerR family transcriptional regulator n=1 Tax=Actinoplanes awajinensis subsp. mycoplanecinus TaxID=135947 RepID=A0A124G8T2_9ACTN|nr:MerR family transcriptional regulator [Actinoplanes awajinensis]KUL26937.1 MerR family transcriptional regulator [Actinoplanes awajinensis subsp. mycoplanecinus]
MRIKELSRRADVSPRLLRYYKEQGLLSPSRSANGYRDYDEALLVRVLQIRSLLSAGLTTEIIREVLPCLAEAANSQYPAADFVNRVRQERDRMAERLDNLTRNLQAIDAYLAAVTDE